MKKTCAIATLLLLTVVTGAVAETGIPWVGSISPANEQELSLFVLPDGSGQPLTEAMAIGGETRDGSLIVGLISDDGFAIVAFPWEDLWLGSDVETQSNCVGMGSPFSSMYFIADHNTDQDGLTSFTGSTLGGGWTESPVWVYLNGNKAEHPTGGQLAPVPLRFNSADINADGFVDLNDISIFATDYYGDYMYRSDFHWDGAMDLNDLAIMASSIGHNCD